MRYPSQANMKLRIEATLERFFYDVKKNAKIVHPIEEKLISAIQEFTLRKGAKRTRGVLVLLGFLSGGKEIITDDILKLAAAYEILQSYLLIHDDIIDNDDERRGKPTLHRIFSSYVPASARAMQNKVGVDIAIIAGDVASELVQRMIFSTHLNAKKKLRVLTQLNRTLYTTYVGQVLDIMAIPEKIPSIASQWLRYEQKTATYTIETPFMLGAYISGAKVSPNKFHEFAVTTGVAFQLADDVQNVFGKGIAARQSDVREGKITLLISLALQSTKYRESIIWLLKKKPKTSHDIRRLKILIKQSGGYDKALQHITSGYSFGIRALDSLHLPKEVRLAFAALLLSLQKSLNQAR